MFHKFDTILHNPEVLLARLKICSRQRVSIRKNRDLMIKIYDEIDILLS